MDSLIANGAKSAPSLGSQDMNYLIAVLDSVSYEQWQASRHPNIDEIGPTVKAYSHGTWTTPSLVCMAKGLFPAPRDLKYKRPFQTALDTPSLRQYLPKHSFLLYTAHPGVHLIPGFVEMFGQQMLFHYDISTEKIIDSLLLLLPDLRQPWLIFMLLLETHYPYMGATMPQRGHEGRAKSAQQQAVAYVDKHLGRLFDAIKQTYVIITSDHGDMFGEDGSYGHDPRPEKAMPHPKLLEVFLVEGEICSS